MNPSSAAAGRNGPADAPGDPAGRVSSCARCGAAFRCGAAAGGCWCAALPALPRLPHALPASCLCEACLRAEIAAQAADGA
jgi:hypothetical protein